MPSILSDERLHRGDRVPSGVSVFCAVHERRLRPRPRGRLRPAAIDRSWSVRSCSPAPCCAAPRRDRRRAAVRRANVAVSARAPLLRADQVDGLAPLGDRSRAHALGHGQRARGRAGGLRL